MTTDVLQVKGLKQFNDTKRFYDVVRGIQGTPKCRHYE